MTKCVLPSLVHHMILAPTHLQLSTVHCMIPKMTPKVARPLRSTLSCAWSSIALSLGGSSLYRYRRTLGFLY